LKENNLDKIMEFYNQMTIHFCKENYSFGNFGAVMKLPFTGEIVELTVKNIIFRGMINHSKNE